MSTEARPTTYTGNLPHGEDLVAVIVSRWNAEITEQLYQGAESTLRRYGLQRIVRYDVPGAYELPQAANLVAGHAKCSAIICLGCIIKGETRHDEYIAQAVAQGLMNLSMARRLPVVFGVLTTENHAQAVERAGGKLGNKGVEAAVTALEMIDLNTQLVDKLKAVDSASTKRPIGFV